MTEADQEQLDQENQLFPWLAEGSMEDTAEDRENTPDPCE